MRCEAKIEKRSELYKYTESEYRKFWRADRRVGKSYRSKTKAPLNQSFTVYPNKKKKLSQAAGGTGELKVYQVRKVHQIQRRKQTIFIRIRYTKTRFH